MGDFESASHGLTPSMVNIPVIPVAADAKTIAAFGETASRATSGDPAATGAVRKARVQARALQQLDTNTILQNRVNDLHQAYVGKQIDQTANFGNRQLKRPNSVNGREPPKSANDEASSIGGGDHGETHASAEADAAMNNKHEALRQMQAAHAAKGPTQTSKGEDVGKGRREEDDPIFGAAKKPKRYSFFGKKEGRGGRQGQQPGGQGQNQGQGQGQRQGKEHNR